MSTDSDKTAVQAPRPLQTSDIARAVGVHPNTVRLYEEWGYLPPAPRSETGYRQFSTRHLAQMKLARLALADPFPGRHIRRSLATVVRQAAAGALAGALNAAHRHRALVEQELAQSLAAADYLEEWAAGEIETADDFAGLYSGETAELLQVSKDTLRHWERNGLIDPPRDPSNNYRLYGPQDIGRLRVLRLLTRAGYSTMAVLRMIHSLDHGYREGLGEMLDMPAEDDDVHYAADRWLTTLRVHEERSPAIIMRLDAMIASFGSQVED